MCNFNGFDTILINSLFRFRDSILSILRQPSRKYRIRLPASVIVTVSCFLLPFLSKMLSKCYAAAKANIQMGIQFYRFSFWSISNIHSFSRQTTQHFRKFTRKINTKQQQQHPPKAYLILNRNDIYRFFAFSLPSNKPTHRFLNRLARVHFITICFNQILLNNYYNHTICRGELNPWLLYFAWPKYRIGFIVNCAPISLFCFFDAFILEKKKLFLKHLLLLFGNILLWILLFGLWLHVGKSHKREKE